MMHIHACSVNQWSNEASKIIVGGVNGFQVTNGSYFCGSLFLWMFHMHIQKEKKIVNH